MYLVIIIIISFEEKINRSFLELRLDLNSLELELELKCLELKLELELKLFVSSGIGIGIGIENNGIGIGIELKKWNWPQPWFLLVSEGYMNEKFSHGDANVYIPDKYYSLVLYGSTLIIDTIAIIKAVMGPGVHNCDIHLNNFITQMLCSTMQFTAVYWNYEWNKISQCNRKFTFGSSWFHWSYRSIRNTQCSIYMTHTYTYRWSWVTYIGLVNQRRQGNSINIA